MVGGFTKANASRPLNVKLRLLYRGVARDLVLARTTLGILLAPLNFSKAAVPFRPVMWASGRSARAESAIALALLGPALQVLLNCSFPKGAPWM